MAVLAAQDWHLPSPSQAMDSPTTANQPPSRQQHSPSPNSVNHSSTMAQQSGQQLPLHLQQQPYPYPVQQQQASWSPSNAPYYPGFYQNSPPHSPYIHQGHQAQMSPNPFYDANNQLAQWAYQQMMFSAQQNHQIPMYPQHPAHSGSQRGRSGSNGAQQDFYPANNVFNPFPSGTPPPPHPPPGNNGYPRGVTGDSSQLYGGFHPYRRPNRQQNQDTASPPQQHDWRSNPGSVPVFQPPYARNDASSSSTSVNSTSSQSSRRRKDSQGSAVGGQNGSNPSQSSRSTTMNTPTRPNNNTPGSSSSTNQRPHNRHPSASSTTSSIAARSNGTSSSTNTPPNSTNSAPAAPRPAKPSPLSQGNYTVAEKRMSRDDSDLGKTHEPTPGGPRSGLKSRFRRALSFNPLQEEEPETPSKGKEPQTRAETSAKPEATGSLRDSPDTASSTLPKKSRKPLFNSRLNASTDNISLSSTMSSASMVIRKLGNIGKLTRRNSLAGITSLFKDKKDKEGEEGKSKKRGKKGTKAEASEASVSLATVELDRSEWSAELNGLTPAARLARQHTLKTNAEAAERAKAEAQKNAIATPPAWEKNSSNRQGDLTNGLGSEDGTRPVDGDSDSDDEKSAGPSNNHVSQDSLDGWDDNEDWGEGEDDEEVTIRGGVDSMDLNRDDDMEPWAIGLRRSIEKTRVPAKGILKPSTPVADPPGPSFTTRARSNSYNSVPTHTTEIGPLARIPSSDPDHIDGVHHLHSQQPSPSSSAILSLPPLSFLSNSATDSSDSNPSPQAEKTIFSHSNSSAPVLSAVFSPNPPTLAHRSATAPTKRLTFASNLSVYDTFPSSVYDRRSEPATWSRLTPALAQRIKEELNSYKMEEMEVHAASRIHTQFFV